MSELEATVEDLEVRVDNLETGLSDGIGEVKTLIAAVQTDIDTWRTAEATSDNRWHSVVIEMSDQRKAAVLAQAKRWELGIACMEGISASIPWKTVVQGFVAASVGSVGTVMLCLLIIIASVARTPATVSGHGVEVTVGVAEAATDDNRAAVGKDKDADSPPPPL